MPKNFDAWNELKKRIDSGLQPPYAHCREVWWCSLGQNIGVEIDGKNENYERPVVIIKIYNKESLIVLPLTTKEKYDAFHHRIICKDKVVWAKLSQSRVISSKRLLRKVNILSESEFEMLKAAWKRSL